MGLGGGVQRVTGAGVAALAVKELQNGAWRGRGDAGGGASVRPPTGEDPSFPWSLRDLPP